MDGDNWGIGSTSFCDSGVFVGTKSGNMSSLVTLEAESALYPLLFVFICHGGSGPCSPYVHGIGVAVVERIPPLHTGGSSMLISSFDSFFEEYIFLLMGACCLGPVVPCDGVVDVTFQPHSTPATPPTCIGMLQNLNHTQDVPNEADIYLWTHRDDNKDMVCAMLDAPEDAENLEDAKEDLEDAHYLYRAIMGKPYS